MAEFCCNNHVNASTGVSPFFAPFGHNPRLDFWLESIAPNDRNVPEFISRMQKISKICNENITLAQEVQRVSG